MAVQRLVVQRGDSLALAQLTQFAVGMIADVALQPGDQGGDMKSGLFTGDRVLLQGPLRLRGRGQQDILDVLLILGADVQTSA
ncbi:hypothetical protein D3C85_612370 [compost metagenome]